VKIFPRTWSNEIHPVLYEDFFLKKIADYLVRLSACFYIEWNQHEDNRIFVHLQINERTLEYHEKETNGGVAKSNNTITICRFIFNHLYFWSNISYVDYFKSKILTDSYDYLERKSLDDNIWLLAYVD